MSLSLHRQHENLIYAALWLLLFSIPALNLYLRTQSDADTVLNWASIYPVWRAYLAYFIIFLVHNSILAPLLIVRRKRGTYLIATFCLILLSTAYLHYVRPLPSLPTQALHTNMLPDMGMGGVDMTTGADFRPLPSQQLGHMLPATSAPTFLGEKELVEGIVLILLLGMNLGVKLYFNFERKEQKLRLLEEDNLRTQMEHLKYQVNPHFFMNTLNNIHALVDIDPKLAQQTILQLSKLMRYILYEGGKQLVPVRREQDFLNNYIELMKLRFTDHIDLSVDSKPIASYLMMPPLLLVIFVENAFKHGISYERKSFIHIRITTMGYRLLFECSNSNHSKTTDEQTGIGLSNVHKRLALLYQDNYKLDISDSSDRYDVRLDIPLHHNHNTATA